MVPLGISITTAASSSSYSGRALVRFSGRYMIEGAAEPPTHSKKIEGAAEPHAPPGKSKMCLGRVVG